MGLTCPCGKLLNATTDGYICIFCKFSVSYIGAHKIDWRHLLTIDKSAVDQAVNRYVLAQQILDNIASNSSGLEVRDIL